MASQNFTPKHISSHQLLERIDPAILLRFLRKYRDFFIKESVLSSNADAVDYDRLSLLLASPSEVMPGLLMADLFYWNEVAEMAQIEDLNEIAERQGIAFNDEICIEEAALLVRMEAPEDLEDLYAVYQAHGLLRKKKRFLSYFATVTELATWKKPTPRMLTRFSHDMDAWYESQKKGRGTRVSVIEKDDAAWFIIRHGGTFKKENAVDKGEPTLVFYRPEAYDLLIYYHGLGELAIYNEGHSKRERQAYCTYLGKNLFDNPSYFERNDSAKYSLEPLRQRGRAALDCSDVPGVQHARLTDLRYQFNGGNHHRVTHKAEDVFAGLEDLGESIPEGAQLVLMGVKLMLDSALGGERTVRLHAPNVSVYDHERDAEVAHRFLALKGFIIDRAQRRRDG